MMTHAALSNIILLCMPNDSACCQIMRNLARPLVLCAVLLVARFSPTARNFPHTPLDCDIFSLSARTNRSLKRFETRPIVGITVPVTEARLVIYSDHNRVGTTYDKDFSLDMQHFNKQKRNSNYAPTTIPTHGYFSNSLLFGLHYIARILPIPAWCMLIAKLKYPMDLARWIWRQW